MPKELLGEFEHQVLLALIHQGQEGYSVPVVLELEERTRREIAPAAVYIALRRMEQRGLVTSELRSPGPEDGGRERRYFAVTEEGRERLREARRSYQRLWAGLDEALGEQR